MEEQRRYIRTGVHMDELRSRQEQKQRRRGVFYVLLFLLTVAIFAVGSFFLFFKITEIRLEGNEIYTNEQIFEQLSVEEGQHLFSFRKDTVESELRKALPYIGNVTIRRELPSVVVLEISERREELMLSVGGESYLLSGDLQVLGRIGGDELTKSLACLQTGQIKRCIVGESVTFLDGRSGDAIKTLYGCLCERELMDDVRSIDMESRFDISINYDDRFTVYLGTMDNIDVKIDFLSKILERLKPTDEGTIYLANHKEAAVKLKY